VLVDAVGSPKMATLHKYGGWSRPHGTEDAMTDQQPIEPDAIIGTDGAAVPYRRAESLAPAIAPRALIPTMARVATAGPMLTLSALALTAVAAAKAVEMTGRMALQLAGSPARTGAEIGMVPGRVEVTWTRVEIRWPL
jgi:hypothetical protein